MKISATIQARMSSSRLPGKVLKPILGKPMLALQIERLQQSRLIDQVIIATSDSPKDDPIEALAHNLGVNCFRGSEDDVLLRVVAALKAYQVEVHAEFMGDNPLPDPWLVDTIIGCYLKNADRYDFVTNTLRTTFPPGTEVFVYPSQILIDAEKHADPALREHVSIHIYQHPERYRLYNLEAPPWLYAPDLHLEVDTEEDFEVVSAIYQALYPTNPGFTLSQIIQFLRENEALANKNRYVERRWKEFREE
jgi:spore coat polysaccharide biosynthesis protein SpsF